MKKGLIRLAVGVTALLSLGLAACGKSSSSSGGTDDTKKSFTLTVWTHPYVGTDLKKKQEAVFDDMAKDFKKDYPNAKVKFQEIPWANREQKIMTALSSGNGPDVFYMIPDMMTQFADKGIIEPLNDHLSKSFKKSDFSSTSMEAVTYKGKQYGLPMLREVQSMIYNTDILKKVGGDVNNLPKTWKEFDALAAKAKAAGYYGRTYQGGDTLNSQLYPYIWQAGGDVLKGNKVMIDNAAGVSAFKEINKQYKAGYFPEDSITSVDQTPVFMEGKTMSAFGTGYLLSMLSEAKKTNYVVGPPLKDKKQATFGVTGMFSVAQPSKHKEAAARFVEIMTNKTNMSNFCKLTNYIPTREAALGIWKDDKSMSELAKYADIANPGVINPAARTFMPKVQAKVQAMLEGKLTPAQAAKQSATMIKDELKN